MEGKVLHQNRKDKMILMLTEKKKEEKRMAV